jgi:hypothetical protein
LGTALRADNHFAHDFFTDSAGVVENYFLHFAIGLKLPENMGVFSQRILLGARANNNALCRRARRHDSTANLALKHKGAE